MSRTEDSIYQTYFAAAQYDCGNEIQPGINESLEWRDWTCRPTTAGERRITDYLTGADIVGKDLLHIGVGNSSLANRLASDLRACFGTSIDIGEVRNAEQLGLANYSVALLNKFSAAYASHTFHAHWIVDSNPTTFACCFRHFHRMMTAYCSQLRPGGSLITEAKGLRSVSSANSNPEPWRLKSEDWVAVAEAYGLATRSPDGAVLVSTIRHAQASPE